MRIYKFDPKSWRPNVLIAEKQAEYDPKNEDRYLVPKYWTDLEPPEAGENEILILNCGDMKGVGDSRVNPNAKWEVKADYRGEIFWSEEGEEIEIEEIGVKPEDSWYSEKPQFVIEREELEEEKEQLQKDIDILNNELSELAKDLNYSRLFEDAEEEEIIRAEKDEVVKKRNKLYEELDEIE